MTDLATMTSSSVRRTNTTGVPRNQRCIFHIAFPAWVDAEKAESVADPPRMRGAFRRCPRQRRDGQDLSLAIQSRTAHILE